MSTAAMPAKQPEIRKTEIFVDYPAKIVELFRGPARYRVLYGGRGAGRSWGFARKALTRGMERPLRILCARELQKSIKESVHQLLCEQIQMLGLGDYYEILQSEIRGKNGTEIIFEGLRNRVHNIKSLESIDIMWAEEAEAISKDSWDTVIPTIRKKDSEIWVSFNPNLSSDNTYVRFVLNRPPNARVAQINYNDNPWFPAVLETERSYCKVTDPDAYDNIWLGNCKSAVTGAIYGAEIKAAEAGGRIGIVPYDAAHPVHTFWDLGFGDRVSIWFMQQVGLQVRILDYYCNTHKSIDFYLQRMQEKQYFYGTCVLPWDGDTPQLGDGKSIANQMATKGFQVISVPQSKVHVGINATRTIFSQLWFDLDKCTYPPKGFLSQFPTEERQQWSDFWGLSGLRRYQWGEPHGAGQEKQKPLHDLASHPADGLRTMAMWLQSPAPIKKVKEATQYYYSNDAWMG